MSKHLEGWQVGISLIVCAFLATLLIIPHELKDHDFPLPAVDRREQARAREVQQALAIKAIHNPLPYNVRVVGEALRRVGAMRARAAEAASGVRALKRAAKAALVAHDPESLRILCAFQVELFLRAVRQLETGVVTADLEELGGEFLGQAKTLGWLRNGRVNASGAELRAWFTIRFASLTGLTHDPLFAPSLNEWRTYYRLLLNPTHLPALSQQQKAEYRLTVLEALARHDRAFPVQLARGILLHQKGDFQAAANELRGFIQQNEGGRWQLRARNTLASAALASE